MTKTIIRRPPQQSQANDWPADLHPLLAQVFCRRELDSSAELEYSLQQLLPYTDLLGIDQATALLAQALQQQQRILIVGDFDADGATSCAVAIRALRLLGARQVDYIVPNRFEYGYGLTPEIVEVAAQRRPQLIITVDNGIASNAGVAAARQRGIQVLITDHHLPGATLPQADAIVNPNQPEDGFASKHLAGVGVIFYVMLALRAHLRAIGWFEQLGSAPPKLASLLDLVALGTVADVVKLDYNNRILVNQGLARIRKGRCHAGIRALIEIAGRQHQRLVASDLGYTIGPRLNAAGRLDDMSLGIECLLTDDIRQAERYAQQLDTLNKERRDIELSMKEQALDYVTELTRCHPAVEQAQLGLPYGLCLYDEHWHQGVIGIVAARIKEHYHRPVIAFAPAGNDELKGSARSIPGLHIRDVLDAIAARHPGMLSKFGGHAMAAGLTLQHQHYDSFSRAFDEEVRRHVSADDLRGVIYSDGELSDSDFSLELAELLRSAAPWGQGFPEPVFDGIFELKTQRVVGERHLKMQLQLSPQTPALEAIAFNTPEQSVAPGQPAQLHIAYRLDVNEFRGQRDLQLIVEHVTAMTDCVAD